MALLDRIFTQAPMFGQGFVPLPTYSLPAPSSPFQQQPGAGQRAFQPLQPSGGLLQPNAGLASQGAFGPPSGFGGQPGGNVLGRPSVATPNAVLAGTPPVFTGYDRGLGGLLNTLGNNISFGDFVGVLGGALPQIFNANPFLSLGATILSRLVPALFGGESRAAPGARAPAPGAPPGFSPAGYRAVVAGGR